MRAKAEANERRDGRAWQREQGLRSGEGKVVAGSGGMGVVEEVWRQRPTAGWRCGSDGMLQRQENQN